MIKQTQSKNDYKNNTSYNDDYNKIFLDKYNPMSGSCMLAAQEITHELLSKGIKNFTVIEGYITFKNVEWTEQHTWIELGDGKIIDPTRTQWGSKQEWMIYLKNKQKRYTPEQYLSLCEKYPIQEKDIKKYIKGETMKKMSAEITNPFLVKIPKEKLTKEELIAALRQSIIAEEDAIVLYEAYANATNDEVAKTIFIHVADEEKKHVGEFQEYLDKIAGEKEISLIEDGRKETKDHMKESSSKNWYNLAKL